MFQFRPGSLGKDREDYITSYLKGFNAPAGGAREYAESEANQRPCSRTFNRADAQWRGLARGEDYSRSGGQGSCFPEGEILMALSPWPDPPDQALEVLKAYGITGSDERLIQIASMVSARVEKDVPAAPQSAKDEAVVRGVAYLRAAGSEGNPGQGSRCDQD